MLVHPVNYFGHAAVASWRQGRGGLPLGAMLPDFSTMCGARITGSDDEEVAGGIALHHATDAAFHRLAAVTGLMRELDARLERGGCARGPRRAVAHIGVELLLDGVLLDDADYRDAYVLGLEYDAPLSWRDEGDDLRYAACSRGCGHTACPRTCAARSRSRSGYRGCSPTGRSSRPRPPISR
jgi:hypothetical protein